MKWTGVQWVVGTSITAAAVIAALGGPDDAWLKTRTAIWGHPEPRIVNIYWSRKGPKGSYIITLRNPALEDVLILGYRTANPTWGPGGPALAQNVSTAASENGAVTVMGAEEGDPQSCNQPRSVVLPRPLLIESKGARALQVRPYKEPCFFSISILSDHGESSTLSMWEREP